jgi:hypothetical protein
MSASFPTDVLLRNPREAAKAFGIVPKQRHRFLVRFYLHGSQAGGDQSNTSALTFVAKMADRPKINPKTEELHQYNKKRQVHTGFKIEPVRLQFYDDANSAALSMWQGYVNYYFGDFTAGAAQSYAYDVTSPQFQDSGTGFGLTGRSPTGDGDFYFNKIEIYHFYNGMYDVYQLINPRITAFDPDELDYANPEMSMISMSLMYEDLQYGIQQSASGDTSGAAFEEFASGATFDGDVMDISQADASFNDANSPFLPSGITTPINQLLTQAQGALSSVANFRFNSNPSGGSLGMFGNFQFGVDPQDLPTMTLSNPQLAAALDAGSAIDPLTVTQNSVQATATTAAQRGTNGAQYDVAYGQISGATSGYGNSVSTLTNAVLASLAINGTATIVTANGLALTPQGYGVINVRQSGTAQYGYNLNTASDGSSWGYTGMTGYIGPVGPEFDGPYPANMPSGLYGRYGIPEQALTAYVTGP